MNELRVLHSPHLAPYWRDVLQRIGVKSADWFDVASEAAPTSVVFAVGDELDPMDLGRLETLRARGVAMVLGGHAAAVLGGTQATRQEVVGWVGGTSPTERKLFANCHAVRLHSVVAIAPSPPDAAISVTHGTLHGASAQDVVGSVVTEDRGAGSAPCLVLSLPELDALQPRPELTEFELRGVESGQPDSPKPSEIVAAIDHGGLRRLVENALRSAFHRSGLPFVHSGGFPAQSSGAFAVRIDADGFVRSASEATLAMLERARFSASWFLDVERHADANACDWVATLRAAGQDVQSHGFRHYTYRTSHRNRQNLARAAAWLRLQGSPPTAVVAPFGTWNEGFEQAAKSVGARYSSEFSLAYDERPGRFGTGLWQIPTHPICPAIIYDAAAAAVADRSTTGETADIERQIYRHFAFYTQDRLRAGDPVVVYGHPTRDLESAPALFDCLRSEIEHFGERHGAPVWTCSLSELHEFYRHRSAHPISARFDGRKLALTIDGPAPAIVEWPGHSVRRYDTSCSVTCPPRPLATAEASSAPSRMAEESIPPTTWDPANRRRLRLEHRRRIVSRLARDVKRSVRSVLHLPSQ